MERMKALVRDPALLLDLVESAIVLAVALGMLHITGAQQRYTIAVVIAVLALGKGFLTHPFPVTTVPDFGRALLVCFGSYGITHLTADQITLVATFLGTLTTVVARGQITPRYDPVTEVTGAGAGPVRSPRARRKG